MAPPPSEHPPWTGPFPPGQRIAGDGLRARSRRGAFATTWWGRRFVDAMEDVAGAGRVARGRTYARAGQVLSLDVGPGRARAQVQGSRTTPYAVELAFHTWDDETQDDLADAVAGSPAVLAGVLGGAMPEGFERLTDEAGLALFPASLADARFGCTCPDWGDPCKHAAAVVYLLAEWLDTEPFGVLTLRGVRRDDLLARVSARQRPPVSATGGEGEGAVDAAAPALEVALVDAVVGFYGRVADLPDEVPGPRAGVLDELDASVLGPVGSLVSSRLREPYRALTRPFAGGASP